MCCILHRRMIWPPEKPRTKVREGHLSGQIRMKSSTKFESRRRTEVGRRSRIRKQLGTEVKTTTESVVKPAKIGEQTKTRLSQRTNGAPQARAAHTGEVAAVAGTGMLRDICRTVHSQQVLVAMHTHCKLSASQSPSYRATVRMSMSMQHQC